MSGERSLAWTFLKRIRFLSAGGFAPASRTPYPTLRRLPAAVGGVRSSSGYAGPLCNSSCYSHADRPAACRCCDIHDVAEYDHVGPVQSRRGGALTALAGVGAHECSGVVAACARHRPMPSSTRFDAQPSLGRCRARQSCVSCVVRWPKKRRDPRITPLYRVMR